MKKWLAKWLYRELQKVQQQDRPEILAVGGTEEDSQNPPKMRFAIKQAINGKFIEVSTHRPQTRGYDWVTEYYIVPEGKKVSEALTMLMLLKGADD